mgnify:CR=1 FL=1
MKKIFLALILCNSYLFFAQGSNPFITFEAFRETSNTENNRIEGSPYFDESFLPAKILGVEKTFKTRYNVFLDQFEIRYEDETFVLPKDNRYPIINLKDSKYVLLTLNNTYYIESYSNNNFALLKKERIKISEKKKATTGYSSDKPERYVPMSSEFYLKLGEDKIIEFPKNKNVLFDTFPNFKTKINKYLKDSKPSFKQEADLIALTKFLSTL